MLFTDFFSIFSSGSHFVQWTRTILVSLAATYERNISVKLFRNQVISLRQCVIRRSFLFLALMSCSVEWKHFSNLVQGHERNIYAKLFLTQAISMRGDVI